VGKRTHQDFRPLLEDGGTPKKKLKSVKVKFLQSSTNAGNSKKCSPKKSFLETNSLSSGKPAPDGHPARLQSERRKGRLIQWLFTAINEGLMDQTNERIWGRQKVKQKVKDLKSTCPFGKPSSLMHLSRTNYKFSI
jgi:hypothetical protein